MRRWNNANDRPGRKLMLNRRLDSRPQPTSAEASEARLGGNSIEDETGRPMSPPANDAALYILGEPGAAKLGLESLVAGKGDYLGDHVDVVGHARRSRCRVCHP
jgi:hypothetical protein